MAWKKQYTPEQKAEYRAQKRAEMEQLFNRIDEGVKQVFTSERYREYLKFMSRFTNYSANNTMLIMMQKPDATLVASYGKWKQLGRQVDKGQSGIEILAPVAYKTNQIMEIERPVTDEFGNKVYNADGTEQTETLEKPIMDIAFKKVYVFDVSQTSGKEIPDPVQELQGEIDADKKEAMLKALSRATGIDITFEDIKGGAKGYYSPSENKIVVQSGMSDAQTLKTAIHESAHKLLHDPDLKIDTVQSPRSEKEVQAESTAFIVAERFGLDTSDYSFPYIASWSDGKQLEQLTKVLEDVQAAAKKLSAAIESELLKMQKRDLTMAEKLADTELNNIQKAEFLMDECAERGVAFSREDTDAILQYASEHEDISDTVRMIADMEMIQRQMPDMVEEPSELPEEYYAAMDFDTPNFRNMEEKTMNNTYPDYGNPVQNNPNIFGNTPYAQLGDRSELQYFTKLNPRHAENIARQLDMDGVPYSGKKNGYDVTITVNKADIPRYQAAVEKVKAGYQRSAPPPIQRTTAPYTSQRPMQQNTAAPQRNNPHVFGNTPYAELGDKSQVQYFTKLKPRHAQNIAKQLDMDGVPYSGLSKGYTVTITVRKSDIPRYEAAVSKVKASYSRANQQTVPMYDTPQGNMQQNEAAQSIPEKRPELPESLKDVPIVSMSYLEAKQNEQIDALRNSIMVSRACRDFIDQNLSVEYENRNLKGFTQALMGKFGLERTMYTLAATIQIKDLDGRFRQEVKNRAAAFPFDSDNMRLKFLTERHPVMINHLYEHLMDRERELNQEQAAVKKPELPGHLSDKLLLSTDRVELRDDYRGIPETNYYKSSANEYFVDGIGWLDNDAYERELKLSELSAKNFYSKVTKINADCIDAEGVVSHVDMSPQDYQLLTEKTYAPENRPALEMAKAQLAERMNHAGLQEKPVEQYAVRQNTNNRYAICTISADGLVTDVKSNIATVAEAKKALLELYHQKKETVRCELVHPQTLDEKSNEIFRQQSKEQAEGLPDVVYRIQLNANKESPDTHYVQQYIKKPDDTYKVGKVITVGDFETCNAALAVAIAQNIVTENQVVEKAVAAPAPPAPPAPPEQQNDFAIYQLKDGDETRGIRFESFDSLAKQGVTPDIANYDLVYEGRIADVTDSPDLRMQLEELFHKFNMERPEDFTGHSLSVSDVVVVKNQAFYVDTFGFRPLPDFVKPKLNENRILDTVQNRQAAIDSRKDSPAESPDKQKPSKKTKL